MGQATHKQLQLLGAEQAQRRPAAHLRAEGEGGGGMVVVRGGACQMDRGSDMVVVAAVVMGWLGGHGWNCMGQGRLSGGMLLPQLQRFARVGG